MKAFKLFLVFMITVMTLSLCACKEDSINVDTDTNTESYSVLVTPITQIGEGEKTFKKKVKCIPLAPIKLQ